MALFFILFCTLGLSRPSCGDDRLSRVLEEIKGTYGGLPGLTVSYERDIMTRSMAMLGQGMKTDIATGLIHFRPPRSLRVQQKTPKPEEVITDGTTLWWVIPDKNQVYRYPSHKMGRELEVLGDIFQGLKDFEDSFTAVLTAYGVDGEHRIELRPDPPWQEVDHITISVDEDTARIRRVEIYNLLGEPHQIHPRPPDRSERLRCGLFQICHSQGHEGHR